MDLKKSNTRIFKYKLKYKKAQVYFEDGARRIGAGI